MQTRLKIEIRKLQVKCLQARSRVYTIQKRLSFTNPKDHVKSVLRISSAHNKGGPTDINIAQILNLSNFFELNIANQKSVRYSVSMSYFTNIAVQNVNKGFVYITDLTWSLNSKPLLQH